MIVTRRKAETLPAAIAALRPRVERDRPAGGTASMRLIVLGVAEWCDGFLNSHGTYNGVQGSPLAESWAHLMKGPVERC
jgi:hypothetical protein